MSANCHSPLSREYVVLIFIAAQFAISGCAPSSQSLYEGLAKTPHHPVQDSQRFRALNPMQQDFLYATEMVRETHPEPYAAWSKEEFDKAQQCLIDAIGPDTSRATLGRALQSFLSHLRDSHTKASFSSTRGELQYPVSFTWLKDTLFLASVAQETDTLFIGARVNSFDGIPAGEVIERFKRYVGYDNIYDARRTVRWYLVFPALHREARIITSDTLTLELVTREGNSHSYSIVPTKTPQRVVRSKPHPFAERLDPFYAYRILKDQHACYFQFNTMYDLRIANRLNFPMNILVYPYAWVKGIGYFDSFLEGMFEEMETEGVTKLIVDLRNNGGGSSSYGDQLLYYLGARSDIQDYSVAIRFSRLYKESWPEKYSGYAESYSKKFHGAQLPDSLIVTSDFAEAGTLERNYFSYLMDEDSEFYIKPTRHVFKGSVYFLVGEGTYSSAIILSTLIKDNKLFTIVGQPTRGRPSHLGEMLILKLPNSGMGCSISCKQFLRPDVGKLGEDSLYPDVEIWPTFEDLRNGRDPVLDWVLGEAL